MCQREAVVGAVRTELKMQPWTLFCNAEDGEYEEERLAEEVVARLARRLLMIYSWVEFTEQGLRRRAVGRAAHSSHELLSK